MAGMASPAAGLYARSLGRKWVRSVGMGRRWRVAMVLGCGPRPDRCLLPTPKPRPAQLGEGQPAMAHSPDCARRSAVDPPRPGFRALTPTVEPIYAPTRRLS